MSISEKLKGKKNTAALPEQPAVAPNACQKKDCHGAYIPVPVGLKHANGVLWGIVCYKLVCCKCGHIRQRVRNGVREDDLYFWNGEGTVRRNPLNFWTPREVVEKPVFDRAGVPVLDAGGKQICQYDEELKLQFVQKLVSLADRKSRCAQFFTLSEVMNAKVPPAA